MKKQTAGGINPIFVELVTAPPAAREEDVIEFESAAGSKMRLQWKSGRAAQLNFFAPRLAERRSVIQITAQMRVLVLLRIVKLALLSLEPSVSPPPLPIKGSKAPGHRPAGYSLRPPLDRWSTLQQTGPRNQSR